MTSQSGIALALFNLHGIGTCLLLPNLIEAQQFQTEQFDEKCCTGDCLLDQVSELYIEGSHAKGVASKTYSIPQFWLCEAIRTVL